MGGGEMDHVGCCLLRSPASCRKLEGGVGPTVGMAGEREFPQSWERHDLASARPALLSSEDESAPPATWHASLTSSPVMLFPTVPRNWSVTSGHPSQATVLTSLIASLAASLIVCLTAPLLRCAVPCPQLLSLWPLLMSARRQQARASSRMAAGGGARAAWRRGRGRGRCASGRWCVG